MPIYEKVNNMKLSRKQEILNAALICFNQQGIAATSIDEIHKTSQASIGSIYHHFGSKDGIAYTLYRDGLQNYHDDLLEKLNSTKCAESKIKTFITSYMEWVEENPEHANYIFSARSYLVDSQKAEELHTFHENNQHDLALVIKSLIEQKEIKRLPDSLYHPLIIGPAHQFCQLWLNSNLDLKPKEAKKILAQAAWDSLAC